MGLHSSVLGVVAVKGQRHGDRAVIAAAKYDRRPPFGQPSDDGAAPGDAVSVDDDGMDVVERNSAYLGSPLLDDQEAAVRRQMLPVRCYVDDPVQEALRSVSRSRIEHPADGIDADLAGLHPLQASGGGGDVLERVVGRCVARL